MPPKTPKAKTVQCGSHFANCKSEGLKLTLNLALCLLKSSSVNKLSKQLCLWKAGPESPPQSPDCHNFWPAQWKCIAQPPSSAGLSSSSFVLVRCLGEGFVTMASMTASQLCVKPCLAARTSVSRRPARVAVCVHAQKSSNLLQSAQQAVK